MNGSSVLSVSDIPFVYSIVNLGFISYTGSTDIQQFVVVGFIAAIFGTFLAFWHPIQWVIDKFVLGSKRIINNYFIEYKDATPPNYTIKLDDSLIRLSLKTHSIKYQKDKFSGFIYFIITLFVLAMVSDDDNFITALNLQESPILDVITYGPYVLMLGVGWLLHSHAKNLSTNLKLSSLYFLLYSRTKLGDLNTRDLIKTSIDLNDWATVEEHIVSRLHDHWHNLKSYSK